MTAQIEVTIAGSSPRRVARGTTPAALFGDTDAVAALLDGEPVDLFRPLEIGGSLEPVPAASPTGRHILRHSAAHVLAQAVCDLIPGARYAIGPAVEDGFYYDFEVPEALTPTDLERIEARMHELVDANQPFERREVSQAAALELFSDQPYKREIIAGVSETEGDEALVTVYANGSWQDLCRGPHLPTTGKLQAFRLLRVAGAYWRGDEQRAQLQRVYGTAWESPQALEEYDRRVVEAERRDHRRLGAELDLFHIDPLVGPGLVLFHPKGGRLRRAIEDYARSEHEAADYEFVTTPHVAREDLFATSGHLDFYRESMFPAMDIEGTRYRPKPMNCPLHAAIYRSRGHSYRELPIRLFEFGTVYRYERSGVLHGLTRVRGFTQDDAHIFCAPDQLADELASLLTFVLRVLTTFGLSDFEAELATRPEKFVGEPEQWDVATAALRQALERAGLSYVVAEGDGAFYAPKIDVHVRDAIGRRWQMSTLQVDLQTPERFDIDFVNSENQRVRPFMIHRALFGSVERFIAILLEHTAGVLPPWLAPVQARIVPIADRHVSYAEHVCETMRAVGLRAEVDHSDGRMQAKIRDAQLAKIPYALVVGDRDQAAEAVSVRTLDGKERRGLPLAVFVEHVASEVVRRSGARLPEDLASGATP